MIRVGLVGARGYVGRELILALDRDHRFDLAFASSRAMAGERLERMPGLRDGALSRFGGILATEKTPGDVAGSDAQVIVLGLPNGLAAPYAEALSADPRLVVDLSADYRHAEGWVYGSPELNAGNLRGARRIANPGCYATAANLALAPLARYSAGRVSVFGLSGFSGAGTTITSRNDPERLERNVIPYGFGGHGHEVEIARATGLELTFAPHIAGFFRGLLVTSVVPLKEDMSIAAVEAIYRAFYEAAASVRIVRDPPEITDVAHGDGCFIGGFAVPTGSAVLTVTSALDNLRKGAATQALENIVLALGL